MVIEEDLFLTRNVGKGSFYFLLCFFICSFYLDHHSMNDLRDGTACLALRDYNSRMSQSIKNCYV